MKFPLNRIVAFIGPYLAILSGGIATWLVANVGLFGALNVGHDAIANAIIKGGIFVISTLVVWLGHQKWLTGWIAHEARIFGGAPVTVVTQPAPPQG